MFSGLVLFLRSVLKFLSFLCSAFLVLEIQGKEEADVMAEKCAGCIMPIKSCFCKVICQGCLVPLSYCCCRSRAEDGKTMASSGENTTRNSDSFVAEEAMVSGCNNY